MIFYEPQQKKLLRPFSVSAEVKCRGCSLLVERLLTDFGADESFVKAVEKAKEHYGIEIPASTARTIIEKHAEKMRCLEGQNIFKSSAKKTDCIIVEADGGMVPLVNIDKAQKEQQPDHRKGKTLFWKEGIVTFARGQKTVQSYFRATMNPRDSVGKQLSECVKLAGSHANTQFHCIGDGAPWIAEQVESQFGANAKFLIDFYHLSEYLGAAAQCIDPANHLQWLTVQKALMLENRSDKVFEALQAYIDSHGKDGAGGENSKCPVSRCFNYMDKRRKYFDYKAALEAGLPIGSGEIESSVRTIIQHRLKIPGAWWCIENANSMLALETLRANKHWDQYWFLQKLAFSRSLTSLC